MNISSELLFFFSLIGVFNGLLLSVYLIFFNSKNNISNTFLGLLLLAVSIRIGKSVIFYFHNDLDSVFLKIGLSACVFIGPFLYLFSKSFLNKETQFKQKDIIHAISSLVLIGLFIWAPYYKEDRELWGTTIMPLLHFQWFSYIVLTAYIIRGEIKSLFSKKEKINYDNLLIISIFTGVLIIFLVFFTSPFTSYILGAVSFTFIIYIFGLLVFINRNKKKSLNRINSKYNNLKLDQDIARQIESKLKTLLAEEKIYKNSNLKMPDLAKALKVSPHQLSQFINEKLNKNFSQLINEYRIEEAKILIKTSENLTLEAISFDCGFNSPSTFYTEFKKITNTTPSNYRKQNQVVK